MVLESVRSYWSEQGLADVVSGLSLSDDLILRYLPVSSHEGKRLQQHQHKLIDLGAGHGRLEDQLRSLGNRDTYAVTAIDINQSAIDDLLARGVKSGVGDVTQWAAGLGMESIIGVERFDAVVVQAVTPSLLGQDGKEWKSMFDAIDMWLRPGGIFIFNDFRAADMYYSPLANQVGVKTAQKTMHVWARRYEWNKEAFKNLKLPPRTFIVGKVGTEGKNLELGTIDELRSLYQDKSLFERFAQHIDPVDVNHYLNGVMGYQLAEQRFSYYRSRGNHGLLTPVALQVWKKPVIYRYDVIRRGLRYGDPVADSTAKRRMAELAYEATVNEHSGYYVLAVADMIRHAPQSQVIPLYRLMQEFGRFEQPDPSYIGHLITQSVMGR